jgi:energy-coupling factor transport system permease protein
MTAAQADVSAAATVSPGLLARVNPLAKIAAPLPAMTALLFTRDPYTPLAFVAIALLALLIGARLSRRALLGVFVALPLAVVLLTVSFSIWTDPAAVAATPELFRVGDFSFRGGALYVGGSTALRLAALAALGLIGGLTTSGPDLVRSMIQQLRVPYRLGYTALAAYRFVPRFAHELEVIRSAHRVRGVAGGRGPVASVRRSLGYVVPLLASAIRHAERVALSMDSRAFGAHPTRTERHLVPFRLSDAVFVAAFWALTAAVFLTTSLVSAQITVLTGFEPIGVR